MGKDPFREEQHHRGLLLRAARAPVLWDSQTKIWVFHGLPWVHEAETTLACLDDRILEPALTTPGGELGLRLVKLWEGCSAAKR